MSRCVNSKESITYWKRQAIILWLGIMKRSSRQKHLAATISALVASAAAPAGAGRSLDGSLSKGHGLLHLSGCRRLSSNRL